MLVIILNECYFSYHLHTIVAANLLEHIHNLLGKEVETMWTKPAYEDIRLGFEITMYFKTR